MTTKAAIFSYYTAHLLLLLQSQESFGGILANYLICIFFQHFFLPVQDIDFIGCVFIKGFHYYHVIITVTALRSLLKFKMEGCQ